MVSMFHGSLSIALLQILFTLFSIKLKRYSLTSLVGVTCNFYFPFMSIYFVMLVRIVSLDSSISFDPFFCSWGAASNGLCGWVFKEVAEAAFVFSI
ncbi:hypothetical protein AMTRI_Chr09g35630 [Amborella trichopoda]